MLWKRIKWMEGVENWRKYLDAFASRIDRYTLVQTKTKMRIDHTHADGKDNPNVLHWLFTHVGRYIFSHHHRRTKSTGLIRREKYFDRWLEEQRTARWPSLAAWHIEPTDSNLQHSIDRDSVSRSLSAIRLNQSRGLTKQLSAQMLRNERATSSNYGSIVTSASAAEKLKDGEEEEEEERRRLDFVSGKKERSRRTNRRATSTIALARSRKKEQAQTPIILQRYLTRIFSSAQLNWRAAHLLFTQQEKIDLSDSFAVHFSVSMACQDCSFSHF